MNDPFLKWWLHRYFNWYFLIFLWFRSQWNFLEPYDNLFRDFSKGGERRRKKIERKIPKIVAYLCCSAGHMRFTRTNVLRCLRWLCRHKCQQISFHFDVGPTNSVKHAQCASTCVWASFLKAFLHWLPKLHILHEQIRNKFCLLSSFNLYKIFLFYCDWSQKRVFIKTVWGQGCCFDCSN
jgi:hypothetical protein